MKRRGYFVVLLAVTIFFLLILNASAITKNKLAIFEAAFKQTLNGQAPPEKLGWDYIIEEVKLKKGLIIAITFKKKGGEFLGLSQAIRADAFDNDQLKALAIELATMYYKIFQVLEASSPSPPSKKNNKKIFG